ncbi:NAD(P)-dependent oxidoreductase [Kordiimonas marina]|uniref:NAD-dependent epimerase/dehydratase family protein n=1 Tax=Kordiimonas marina TaxID=2872312 RepID=UPI0031BB9D71|nr:NAD(P)-dependent oxidoreductase [Kordiimonas marina]
MKVLVTGGAGYIGSVLVPELLARGHHVTVIDNFLFGQNSLAACCAYEKFDVVNGDARDVRILEKYVPKADIVIPLAALVGAPMCARDTVGCETLNRDAVLSILKLRSKDQRIMMPVTNSGYGIGESGKFCTEESPLRPVSLYGRTKVEAEAATLDAGNCITFRLATVFGMAPRMRIDLLVNDFTYRAVKDRFLSIFEPHFKRNYIHIRDVVRAFLHGIENFETMKNEPYNVGLSDANLSKLELCQKIKQHVPEFEFVESLDGEDPDKRDYIVSNEKIEKTGFKPQYSLDFGIQELVKGYRMISNNRYTNV